MRSVSSAAMQGDTPGLPSVPPTPPPPLPHPACTQPSIPQLMAQPCFHSDGVMPGSPCLGLCLCQACRLRLTLWAGDQVLHCFVEHVEEYLVLWRVWKGLYFITNGLINKSLAKTLYISYVPFINATFSCQTTRKISCWWVINIAAINKSSWDFHFLIDHEVCCYKW